MDSHLWEEQSEIIENSSKFQVFMVTEFLIWKWDKLSSKELRKDKQKRGKENNCDPTAMVLSEGRKVFGRSEGENRKNIISEEVLDFRRKTFVIY